MPETARSSHRTIARAQLRDAPSLTLAAGRRGKGDVIRYALPQGPVVVKDYAARSIVWRWLGRLQLAREERAYRRLGELSGVPRWIGRIDRDAIAVEAIEGQPLAAHHDRGALFSQLQAIVEQLHARGLAHWDLRSERNLLVRNDGGLVVVDFGSAFDLRRWPASLRRRLQAPDRSALLKWKLRWEVAPLTDEERRSLQRFERWRRFWIFNRPRGARRVD